MSLRITGQSEVTLEGYFTAAGQLEFRYRSEELSDHSDTVEVFYDQAVRFTLQSPGGATLRATHDEGRTTVTWAPVSGGVDHSFASGMTDPAEVEAEATPNPAKRIFIQVKPTGGLPDT